MIFMKPQVWNTSQTALLALIGISVNSPCTLNEGMTKSIIEFLSMKNG